ncbi:hypothetical protein RvY_10285 [Ramazzottius varieornatus]|uniref:Bestrophin homolog n=1 Tax=Ramazzottius varieornatus TaxID=947166 RepID=A0A1D1VER2_RAMVA|nr:hypothetical protein RvY_10285 [Ramazzottius varieornatus]
MPLYDHIRACMTIDFPSEKSEKLIFGIPFLLRYCLPEVISYWKKVLSSIMTISYQLSVANATFAGFFKLLARWKGSVYKLMFKELLVFSFLYAFVSAIYRFVLEDGQKRYFEKFCIHIEETITHVPLTFVLGFYVTFVVSRWWEQLNSYPWPDRMILLIVHHVSGLDERSRMLRRTLVRYLNASIILLTRTISVVTKKRFPSVEHLVDAGLLTKEEMALYDKLELQYGKFWVPLVWFSRLLEQGRAEGLIKDASGVAVKQILDELLVFRSLLGKMFMYDWVSIPVSYTQVVTIATYTYFMGCVFARQKLDPAQAYKGHGFDAYVPVFTILQFMFYVGWLKVAESLINPWGEDDDDFEVNWFIDRHVQASYAMVDDMHHEVPPLVKDRYWGEVRIQLPYTDASMDTKRDEECADLGSAMEYHVPLDKQRLSVSPLAPGSRRASMTTHNTEANSNTLQPPSNWESLFRPGLRKKSGVFLAIPQRHDFMIPIEESPSPITSPVAPDSPDVNAPTFRLIQNLQQGLTGNLTEYRTANFDRPVSEFIDASDPSSSNRNSVASTVAQASYFRPTALVSERKSLDSLQNQFSPTTSPKNGDGNTPLLRRTVQK